MLQVTITFNDAEEKVLLTDMVSIQEWLDNAGHNKARRLIDSIVGEKTDKQPKKIPVEEKYQIIRDAQLETAVERNARLAAELLEESQNKHQKRR